MADISQVRVNNTDYNFADDTKVPYDLLQDTVGWTSKNLIPFPYNHTTRTNNGITYTVNADTSITANGTATGGQSYFMLETALIDEWLQRYEAGTDYILSGCPSGGANNTYRLSFNSDPYSNVHIDTGDGVKFTMPQKGSLTRNYIQILVNNGVTVNNLTFRPMLRKADIMDDTYEQYHAPMSSYVDKRLRDALGVTGKNLLIPIGTKTISGLTFTLNSDDSVTVNGTATANTMYEYVQNIADGRYILSGCPSGGSQDATGSYCLDVVVTDASDLNPYKDYGNGVVCKFDSQKGHYQAVRIRIGQGYVANNLTFKPMLRSVDILDGEYEPYGNIQDYTDNALKRTLGNTGKNLNTFPYYDGRNNSTKTENGITWTQNPDGSITANGTATANSDFNCYGRYNLWPDNANALILPNGKYIGSGCPSGGSTSRYRMLFARTKNGGALDYGYDYGNGVELDLQGDDASANNVHLGVRCTIYNGYTANNLTFYPMVRKADIKNSEYEPHYTGALSEQANNILGAKNLVPYPYYQSTHTENGITFTDNGDGTVTVNGTATDNAFFSIFRKGTFQGNYTLTGCPVGDNDRGYKLIFRKQMSTEEAEIIADYGKGATGYIDVQGTGILIIRVGSGTVCNNLLFKPMLRPVEIQDDTYVPYTRTNRELTKWTSEFIGLESQITMLEQTHYSFETTAETRYIKIYNGYCIVRLSVTALDIDSMPSGQTFTEVLSIPDNYTLLQAPRLTVVSDNNASAKPIQMECSSHRLSLRGGTPNAHYTIYCLIPVRY